MTLQVRGIACQHPNSLVYVAGAPTHGQRDKDGDPWLKMDGSFSERHLIEPMRLMATQCAVPPRNLVRAALHPQTGFQEWLACTLCKMGSVRLAFPGKQACLFIRGGMLF